MMKSRGQGEIFWCNLKYMLAPQQKRSKTACLGKRKGMSQSRSAPDENHCSASHGEWEGDYVR